MRSQKRASFAALILFALTALSMNAPDAFAQARVEPLRVFAASSLTDAFNAIAPLYEATGRPRPVFNYAASAALARQIDQGARADIFVSADEAWMDYLAERDLIDRATRVSFLSNKLVLIAPNDRPLGISIRYGFDLAGALNGGRLAMADPDSVPAGRYGRAALKSLGAWDDVAGSIVRAENVRAALRFVETGEAAAGIVYLTDALASGDRVSVAGEFPAAGHPRISYPIAAVSGGRAEEARAFQAFLLTDPARTVFQRMGFTLLH